MIIHLQSVQFKSTRPAKDKAALPACVMQLALVMTSQMRHAGRMRQPDRGPFHQLSISQDSSPQALQQAKTLVILNLTVHSLQLSLASTQALFTLLGRPTVITEPVRGCGHAGSMQMLHCLQPSPAGWKQSMPRADQPGSVSQ